MVILSVAVFAEGAEVEEARAAEADIVGGKELIEELAIWTFHVMSSKLHESSMSERHEHWMTKHGKVYKDATEKEKRFVIFKDNVEFIESFNVAGDKPYKLDINHLADQTKEEFKTSRNGYNYKGPHGLRMIGSRNTIQV